MNYSLEPAFLVTNELQKEIIKASSNIENRWFFTDGSYEPQNYIDFNFNTWLHENFVVIVNHKIIAYFTGNWSRPLNNFANFRLILFDKKYSLAGVKGFFQYLDYLFVARGCEVFSWTVAEKNIHAKILYDKFIRKYCGTLIGKKSNGQMAYTGEKSDVFLYEITRKQYFDWKK